MKKRFVFALAFVLVLFVCAGAWADVAINEANFPDDMFRLYVQYFIAGGDSILTTEQAEGVLRMYDLAGLGITSLKGIEHFPNLRGLDCSNNDLTELDISGNPNLISLNCSYNKLTELDVSAHPNFVQLFCASNDLTELDTSGQKQSSVPSLLREQAHGS